MKQKTVLQELISELERQKINASFKDNIYLDAIIAVCQSKLPKEKEMIEKVYMDANIHGQTYSVNRILIYDTPQQYFEENYGE